MEEGIDGFAIGRKGDPFKAAVVFPAFGAVFQLPEVNLSGGVPGKVVVGRDEAGEQGAVGLELEDGGVVLLADEEVAVLHQGEAFGIEAAAAVLHSGFGIRGIGDQAGERFAIDVFVQPSRARLG